MGMKGFTKIGVPIMTVLLSSIFSWTIAWHIANEALRGELDQGQAVFENIGVRYFYALYRIFECNEEEGVCRMNKDQNVMEAYLSSLSDIQENIAWLITNPIYRGDQNGVRTFSLVQNCIAEEIALRKATSIFATRTLMCSIYSERLQGILTEKNRSKYEMAVIKFAGNICALD